jgi:hypothetical protein
MSISGKKEEFDGGGFFEQGSRFEELARLQGVQPVENAGDLLGGWPGDVDDGFEEAVSAWRCWDLSLEREIQSRLP